MAESARHHEGPVRITATALITPAGSWPLLALGPARLRWVEPDVTGLQLLFMVAVVAAGMGTKAWWQGRGHGVPLLAAGLLLGAAGIWGARRKKPMVVLQIEVDGETVEAWRSADEEAMQRLLTELERARPLLVSAAEA